MALRIDRFPSDRGTVIRIEGDLVGDAVEVLRDQLGLEADFDGVTLDVQHLRYADHRGARLLRRAERSGCLVAGASPFLALLIEGTEDGEPGGTAELESQTDNRDNEEEKRENR